MKILFYISCVYISFSVFRIIFDWHTSPYWVIPSLIAAVIQYKYYTRKNDELDIIEPCRMRQKVIIGIDPGTKTGFAVRNLHTGEWLEVSTIKRWKIPVKVLEYGEQYEIFVVFEDARKRQWYGKKEKALYNKFQTNSLSAKGRKEYKGRAMGSGHVKGSTSIIQEFLDDCQIPYVAQKPKAGTTKLDKQFIARLGWTGRSSEHSRDAIMLIQGYNIRNLKLYFKAT